MAERAKIREFNFIRTVSAMGIVIFHFTSETGRQEFLPGNYSWDGVFVTIFFMVSGALLYYNHQEPENLKLFYYKRWKSLMPDFYGAFLCLYAAQVIKNGSFFYNGRPATLLLTLIGQDGYFFELIPNYYLLGEWFLGAIIILYVLYPVLAKMINKKEILTLVVIAGLYVLSLLTDISYIKDFRSIFSCVFSFTLGIEIQKHKIYRYRWLAIPALICFVIGNFLIRNSGDNLSSHAGGVLLFFTLFSCGSLIYQSGALGRLSDFLSGISYDVFLIHHVLLVQIVKIIPPFDTLFLNLIYLMFCIILIVVAAGVFSKIMKTIMQLKVFSDLDRQIIKRIG